MGRSAGSRRHRESLLDASQERTQSTSAAQPKPIEDDSEVTATFSKSAIEDFISGLLVPATPEELDATQPFSQQLVEDYGYPRSHIQTRPQFRVKASPSGARSFPVDIAVFSEESRSRDDLYIVVECKKRGTNPEEGDNRQLFNYMNMSSAELGVWTDGVTREFWRKTVDGQKVAYERIPNLPRFQEPVSEIGKYVRKNLRPPRHLNTTFRVLRSHLAGNAVGTTRDETLAAQLINLVFCKIYDERFTPPEDLVTFRFQLGEDPADVGQRIRQLFTQVKAKYSDVFDDSDTIALDDTAIAYVVGELQPFALTEASRDAVGEAFEVFIGAALKGGQGQFFTPRNAIKLMMQIIGPSPDDLVIDPACGAGGFLVEALRHKWAQLDEEGARLGWNEQALQEERQSSAIRTIFGIEKDSFLAKVAKAYMAILGDGKGGIFCEDSLERPEVWSTEAQRHVQLGRFDVVLANPPFGKEIKVLGAQKLQQFDLGHKWTGSGDGKIKTSSLLEEQNPQVLFVERCIQLAKDGGVIGLILPETYFHAPTPVHVRRFMTNHNVMALIDLPHNTFRPFNNAKCVAIIFQKNRPQQKTITMVAADQMGHDHRGMPMFRYDPSSHQVTNEIWDDLSAALVELREPSDENRDYVFQVSADDVSKADIYIPRYYWPKLTEEIEPPDAYAVEWKTLREFQEAGALAVSAGHGSPPAAFKGKGPFPYVRVKDIVNWEIYRDPTSSVPSAVYEGLVRKNPLEFEDIVYVSRGSYRIGDVAMVGPDDTAVALTREINVLRVIKDNSLGLDPYYLLYLLTTRQVALQTKGKVFLDTTLPTIGQRYLDIKLPWAVSEEKRREISQRVRGALSERWKSMQEIREMLVELRPESALDVDDLDDAVGNAEPGEF